MKTNKKKLYNILEFLWPVECEKKEFTSRRLQSIHPSHAVPWHRKTKTFFFCNSTKFNFEYYLYNTPARKYTLGSYRIGVPRKSRHNVTTAHIIFAIHHLLYCGVVFMLVKSNVKYTSDTRLFSTLYFQKHQIFFYCDAGPDHAQFFL